MIDVVIAGGAAVGSATAHFLTTQPAFTGSVVVVEPEPTYAFAASARSAASIRQQFSTPLNIALSTFGIEFLRRFHDTVADVSLVESTYLYLASAAGEAILRQNVDVQRGCGIATRVSDAAGLTARYPWINAADIAAASDPPEGEGCSTRMRCFGPFGGTMSAAAYVTSGIASTRCELPVFPRKRSVFVFTSPTALEHCPMVIDTSGLWFRPEHDKFICGIVPTDDCTVAPDDFEVDHAQFDASM